MHSVLVSLNTHTHTHTHTHRDTHTVPALPPAAPMQRHCVFERDSRPAGNTIWPAAAPELGLEQLLVSAAQSPEYTHTHTNTHTHTQSQTHFEALSCKLHPHSLCGGISRPGVKQEPFHPLIYARVRIWTCRNSFVDSVSTCCSSDKCKDDRGNIF